MKYLAGTLIMLLAICSTAVGQQKAYTFQEAQDNGISIQDLDSNYKSAVHVDTTLAVFKSEKAQEAMRVYYTMLLKDLGLFLSQNDFKWDEPRRCFNRIYFDRDGSIDYFLFKFLGNAQSTPPVEKQEEFKRLLELFVKEYEIPLAANVKFAQCSPTTYMPE